MEPNLITEEFVHRLKKVNKICKHFHLSLQSGCTQTLKRMNRKYNTDEFQTIVERLRKVFPDVMLTTDIIVGFPGETDEEFEITYKYLQSINFYKMHIFKYSPRKGTVAEKMSNQIDGKIKEQRSRKLIELSNKNEKEYLDRYIDKNIEVLFEKEENHYFKGHTNNYLIVNAKGRDLENKLKTVRILKQEDLELYGEII